MKSGGLFLVLVVVTVFMALTSLTYMYFSISNLVIVLSGRATGEANLTVESSAVINFTTASLNWQSGRVNNGQSAAFLDTAAGTVVRGNWTAVTSGLKLENTGNINVTLNLSVGKSAASFIGGTSPSYRWNITNHEASSCLNSTGGTAALNLGVYYNPNTTSALFCPIFQFADTADTINISINLTVPSDSITGALGDVVTATAY